MTHNTTTRAPRRPQLLAATSGWAAPADASTPHRYGLEAVRCPA